MTPNTESDKSIDTILAEFHFHCEYDCDVKEMMELGGKQEKDKLYSLLMDVAETYTKREMYKSGMVLETVEAIPVAKLNQLFNKEV